MASFKSLYFLGLLVAMMCSFATAQILDVNDEGFPPIPNNDANDEGFPPISNNDAIDEGFPPIPNNDAIDEGFPPMSSNDAIDEGFPPMSSNDAFIGEDFPPISKDEKHKIFMKFASQEMASDEDLDGVESTELIKKTQEKFNLPMTGVIDDATMRLAPRCGVARNWIRNFRFTKKNIKWSIFNYSPDLSPCQQRNIIRKAFRMWEEVTDLTFVEAHGRYDNPDRADIKIRFGYSKHYDKTRGDPAFDGTGHVLAHAYPQWGGISQGELHFDEAEFWTLDSKRVVVTYEGNSDGSPCVFPFKFNNKLYHTCTQSLRDRLEWCSTTDDYDQDNKWGYCPQPELFTFGGNSGGEACTFPFLYNKVIYSSCTDVNGPTYIQNGYMWCSTTNNFDRDHKWGYCPSKVNSGEKNTDMLYTTVHELGHVLGFAHSNSSDSIMYKFIRYVNAALSQEDVAEVQKKYGKRRTSLPDLVEEKCGGEIDTGSKYIPTTTRPTTASPTTTTTTTTTLKPIERKLLCKLRSFDASLMLPHHIYYFKALFMYNAAKGESNREVEAMRIVDKFKGGPRRVDAAFTLSDYSMMLFRGKRYWKYDYYGVPMKVARSVEEIGLKTNDFIKAILPINAEQIFIFYNDYYVSYNPRTMKLGSKKFATPAEFSPPDGAIGGDVHGGENKDVLHLFKHKIAYQANVVTSEEGELTLKVDKVLKLKSYLQC